MPHIHAAIDFTAEVFIVNQGKVLLRKHDKYKIWLSVGGHIELDEDPNQAAVREAKEEVGLDIQLYPTANRDQTEGYTILVPPVFMNRHRISETHEHVTLVYFATTKQTTIKQPTTAEKVDECQWLTASQVKELTDISEVVRQYALEALQTVTG